MIAQTANVPRDLEAESRAYLQIRFGMTQPDRRSIAWARVYVCRLSARVNLQRAAQMIPKVAVLNRMTPAGSGVAIT
jgi:hypothetical protein